MIFKMRDMLNSQKYIMNRLKVLQNLKLRIRQILGKEVKPKIDIKVDYKFIGSSYGGWNVITDELNSDSVVYSFGVGEDVTFDLDLIHLTGCKIYAFDPTPRSIDFVKRITNLPSNFQLMEYGVSDKTGYVNFFKPINENHISHTIFNNISNIGADFIKVPMKSIRDIMSELNHSSIDVLKMDIEGSEYCVIKNMLKEEILPMQLLIEFHHRFDSFKVHDTLEIIKSLKENGYKLFAVSASGIEYSFVRI